MTQAPDAALGGDIVARLHVHWPDAEISVGNLIGESESGDSYAAPFVRVRVAEQVYLDAVPRELAWAARPMMATVDGIQPVPSNREYTIGVTTDEGSEAIADRFYEEVRFWWARLQPNQA